MRVYASIPPELKVRYYVHKAHKCAFWKKYDTIILVIKYIRGLDECKLANDQC
jgi:hypothetical protein